MCVDFNLARSSFSQKKKLFLLGKISSWLHICSHWPRYFPLNSRYTLYTKKNCMQVHDSFCSLLDSAEKQRERGKSREISQNTARVEWIFLFFLAK